ncbi:MAG: DUF3341 domain-containing protein [Cyclobacteriaceae bacterium]|nr:DUF3341 domain-containing protein [Cyclobacteriaceae bacterium]
MDSGKNYLVGIYEDEDVLLAAVKKVRSSGVKIHEVFSPYPVHGLDEALGYKRTRLPIAAFMFGFLGTLLALIMQTYMLAIDWPMIIGGKNYTSVTYVPVTFEMTVLLSAFGMVGTFLVVSNMKPWAKPRIFDLRSTDDKHVMAVDLDENSQSPEEITNVLNESGASEVNSKQFED